MNEIQNIYLNIDSVLHAELIALLFGLKEASKFHFPSILLESDSLLAIKEIKKLNSFSEWEGIIYDVFDLSLKFQSCSFFHVRRAANSCAHNLTRFAEELGVYRSGGIHGPQPFVILTLFNPFIKVPHYQNK